MLIDVLTNRIVMGNLNSTITLNCRFLVLALAAAQGLLSLCHRRWLYLLYVQHGRDTFSINFCLPCLHPFMCTKFSLDHIWSLKCSNASTRSFGRILWMSWSMVILMQLLLPLSPTPKEDCWCSCQVLGDFSPNASLFEFTILTSQLEDLEE